MSCTRPYNSAETYIQITCNVYTICLNRIYDAKQSLAANIPAIVHTVKISRLQQAWQILQQFWQTRKGAGYCPAPFLVIYFMIFTLFTPCASFGIGSVLLIGHHLGSSQ